MIVSRPPAKVRLPNPIISSRVEGLLWHMAGRWELRLDVEAAGVKQSLRQSVTLP